MKRKVDRRRDSDDNQRWERAKSRIVDCFTVMSVAPVPLMAETAAAVAADATLMLLWSLVEQDRVCRVLLLLQPLLLRLALVSFRSQ